MFAAVAILLSSCGETPDITMYVADTRDLYMFDKVKIDLVLNDTSEKGVRNEQPLIQDIARNLRDADILRAANITYTIEPHRRSGAGGAIIDARVYMYSDADTAQMAMREKYAVLSNIDKLRPLEGVGDVALGTYSFDGPSMYTKEKQAVSFTVNNIEVSLLGPGNSGLWTIAWSYADWLRGLKVTS